VKNIFKSLKFIYYLARFSPENYPQVNNQDITYRGLDNQDIPLKLLTRKNKNDQWVVIMFPGASHNAEEHPGILFLGSIICKLGFRVFIPRIPPLKQLKINKECFDWVAHAYNEIINRDDINKNKVISMALSFGGGLLLKASIDPRISNHPPKSIMTFGTYYDIESTLNFLCDGKIKLNGEDMYIKPHSWGLTVLLHNFFDKFNLTEINQCRSEIRDILSLKIQDKDDEVDIRINELKNEESKQFIRNILNCNINDKISNEIYRVITQQKQFIETMSPKYWSEKIDSKIFIMHGSNDSMVPYTESIKLHKYIKNSSLFISYMYEHKEISTNRGILFKLREFYKMYSFFKSYFKYNEN